jgi:hypothetical protein
MNISIYIQFNFLRDEVISYLPQKILNAIGDIIKNNKRFSSLTLERKDWIYNELLNNNIIKNNKNIIRLIREYESIDYNDINEKSYYELKLDSEDDHEVDLLLDPSNYYNLNLECEHCGRYNWMQKSDIHLKKDIKNNIEETNNGEIVILKQFMDIMKNNNILNVNYRKTNKDNIFQVSINEHAIIEKNNMFIEQDFCSICNKPRIVKYEDTNKVSLFDSNKSKPRIERTPILAVKHINGDISYSNFEFGTIGRIPEGAPVINKKEFTYKTSWKNIIISGRFGKLLFETKTKGFRLIRCNVL